MKNKQRKEAPSVRGLLVSKCTGARGRGGARRRASAQVREGHGVPEVAKAPDGGGDSKASRKLNALKSPYIVCLSS